MTMNEIELERAERTGDVLDLTRLTGNNTDEHEPYDQFDWSSSNHPEWFQLSGHPDSFSPAGPGTIWKKCCDSTERRAYEALTSERTLLGVIPRYIRAVQHENQTFIELQDLLDGFQDPQVMDIKMGTRTFLESEVQNTTPREDLYKKMIAIDPSAPTEEEHRLQAITKLRYMQFRENQSSTRSHGFRIEAIKSNFVLKSLRLGSKVAKLPGNDANKLSGEPPRTNLKRVKSLAEVQEILRLFLKNNEEVKLKLVVILRKIRNKLEQSQYLKTHEVVGSSILVIYDNTRVSAWLIDFAKTRSIPENMTVNHRSPWIPGNREEGLLFGLDNLIKVLETLKLNDVIEKSSKDLL